jgi:hypothetical protein
LKAALPFGTPFSNDGRGLACAAYGRSLAIRLILDLQNRTHGQPSPVRFAGWQSKHGDGAELHAFLDTAVDEKMRSVCRRGDPDDHHSRRSGLLARPPSRAR